MPVKIHCFGSTKINIIHDVFTKKYIKIRKSLMMMCTVKVKVNKPLIVWSEKIKRACDCVKKLSMLKLIILDSTWQWTINLLDNVENN